MHQNQLRRNFGSVHAVHVAALTRHLIACRETFEGDLDLFLVFTIIGERCFTPRNATENMTHSEFLARSVGTVEPVAINVQSIAEFSGIPRETVRRKIGILIAKGWIRQDAKRYITVTDDAKDQLSGLTESALKYLGEIGEVLNAPASGPEE